MSNGATTIASAVKQLFQKIGIAIFESRQLKGFVVKTYINIFDRYSTRMA